jgi:hypothetical protein
VWSGASALGLGARGPRVSLGAGGQGRPLSQRCARVTACQGCAASGRPLRSRAAPMDRLRGCCRVAMARIIRS